MAQLHSRIERDVTVTIGPERNKRRKKVTLEIFKKWLEVSLDIRGFFYPAHIIETGVGDIILDKRFSGKVYCKGILLLDSTTEAASYKMGYNFLTGIAHRGRLEMTCKEERSNLVRQMWEAAIGQDEAILPIYVDLLWNSPGAPDVERADHLLETCTRSLIWKYLLMKTNGEQFYYSESCHVKVSASIRPS
jgi:hypothetical protein